MQTNKTQNFILAEYAVTHLATVMSKEPGAESLKGPGNRLESIVRYVDIPPEPKVKKGPTPEPTFLGEVKSKKSG